MLFDDEEDFIDLVPAGAKPSADTMIGYIPAQPKPGQAVDLKRDQVGLGRDRLGAQRDQIAIQDAPLERQYKQTQVDAAGRKPRETQFDQSGKLADDYRQRPSVKAYTTALPLYGSALRSPENAEGDLILINAFAKITDPTSAVLTGEADTIAQSGGIAERTAAKLQKDLALGGGVFSPSQRIRLRKAVASRMGQLNQAFIGERRQLSQTAERFGLNPLDVIGEHPGGDFQAIESEFLDRPVKLIDENGQPIVPGNMPAPAMNFGAPRAGGARPGEATVEVQLLDDDEAALADKQAAAYERFTKAGLSPIEVQTLMKQWGEENGVKPEPLQPIDNGDGALGAGVRGFGDTATFGTLDELGGFADTVGQAIGGDLKGQSFGDALSGNIDRNRAIIAGDEQNHGTARMVGQFAGALVPGGGWAAAARTPGQLARVGAVQGGAYGFGSGEGNALERAPNALMGAAAGGTLGYGLGRATQAAAPTVNALARRVMGPGTPAQRELVAAGERQGVQLNASDVRSGAGNAFAFLESMPGSSGRIQRSIAGGRDDIERRALEGAGGVASLSNAATGERVARAGDRLIRDSGQMVDTAFNRARSLAPDTTTVQPQSALAELDGLIGRLGRMSGTNAPKLSVLNRIRGDLVETVQGPNGPVEVMRSLNIDDVRGLRRSMREALDADGLTMSLKDAELQGVVRAASDDMYRTLQGVSPQAAQAWRRADTMHAQRMDYIEDVLEPVLGSQANRNGGEAVFSKLTSMMSDTGRGDSRTLNRLMRSLSPEERLLVNSRIIHSAGRASPDEPFSPARFIASARNISPRARITMFGREGARAFDDLISLSEAKKATVGRLNNSRSGQVSNYREMIGSALFGGGGAALGAAAGAGPLGATVAVGLMGAGNVVARIMTNPDFARALAGAPRTTNPAAINRHVDRLRRIAGRDPGLRGVVEGLQRNMLQLVSAPSTRVAAEDRDQQRPPRP